MDNPFDRQILIVVLEPMSTGDASEMIEEIRDLVGVKTVKTLENMLDFLLPQNDEGPKQS